MPRRPASRGLLLGLSLAASVGCTQAARAQEAEPDAGGLAEAGGAFGSGPANQTVAVAPLPGPVGPDTNLLAPTSSAVPAGATEQAITQSLQVPAPGPAARPWSFSAAATLGEEYTSNVLDIGGADGGSDVATLLQPSLALSGATSRLQGSILYNPTGEIHAIQPELDRFDQMFNAAVRAAIIPDTFFVDLRGFGDDVGNGLGTPALTGSARSGALPTVGAVAAEQSTQTDDVSVQPYLQHRFGTDGTGEIGAVFEHVSQTPSGDDVAGNGIVSPFALPGQQDANTLGAHAAFQTGEALERYSGAALVDLAHTSGTGVLASASRDTGSVDNGYAVTRNVIALARVGYEYITYAGSAPIRIDDTIWGVGVRLLTPGDGSVELRYGHHDGFNAASLDAAWRLGTRTRFYARYSEGLNTATQMLSNALASSDPDALGTATDRGDGAPLLLADGFFGSDDNLYRTRLGSATLELAEPRDVFTLGVQVEDNRIISVSTRSTTAILGNNSGAYGTIGWSHEWTPTLTLSANAEFGIRRADGASEDALGVAGADVLAEEVDDVGAFSAVLVRQLNEKMSVQLRYDYERVDPQRAGESDGYDASIVLCSITRQL